MQITDENNIALKEIVKGSSDEKEVKGIFIEAFPPDERPPYWILKNRAKKPFVKFYGINNDRNLIGFAYIIENKDLAYLFFLALKPELRGRGYGSKVMLVLLEKYTGKRLFLALEQLDETADNYDERLKRHSFYEKFGLKDMPYKLREVSVTYAVMGTGGEITSEEYKELINKYLGISRYLVKMELIKD